MKINRKLIEKYNPCVSRFKNFLSHYHHFDGEVTEFLALDKISYTDKIWVMTRLLSKEQNLKLTLTCVEPVLSQYELKYPNDKRARNAVELTKEFLANPSKDTANKAKELAEDVQEAARYYEAAYNSTKVPNAFIVAYAASYTAFATSYYYKYNGPYNDTPNAAYAALCAVNVADNSLETQNKTLELIKTILTEK